MRRHPFDAVIFDLDGVITKTALVHSTAWKKMFDAFLKSWSDKHGEPFRAFDYKNDYLPYVDGRPRYDGVRAFLESRGITLPYGTPDDNPDMETVCGLGNRKNLAFNEVLQRDGVETYPTTVELIRKLKAEDIKVGVASSSKNCKAVLEAAGILHLFETRVDGVVSAELGLQGKPAPDIFTTAADNLGVSYDRAVVVEDAVSGVQAGRAGNFGLVLGIAREGNEKKLYRNGADIVVKDIGELGFEGIIRWFEEGLQKDSRSLTYRDYDPAKERSREALLTVGNGYFGTRGAMEEVSAGRSNYPGTYVAGLYNRLVSQVAGRAVENEDFVNIPNWLPLTFRIDDGEWFDPDKDKITGIVRTLDFSAGILSKTMTVKDHRGRITTIRSRRLASMADPHVAGLEYVIAPENYSALITVRSMLDGTVINDGVERYRQLNRQHLQRKDEGAEGNLTWLSVETTQSKTEIAEAAKLNIFVNGSPVHPVIKHETKPAVVSSELQMPLSPGKELKIEKIISIYTSKPDDTPQPQAAARNSAMAAKSFQKLADESRITWASVWNHIDIELEGDRLSQKLLRLHLYHLMVSFSQHNRNIDASITARGLHGEAYRGHIFWDELFILPFYAMHFPDTARAMLMYRYRRLDKARKYAASHGYKGAMFPWQSGSDGSEQTQVVHLNPVSGEWGDDYSSLQRHVSLAIAYNISIYYTYTGDKAFLRNYGMEIFLEICRFWASKAYKDEKTGRYSIKNVMGPDEFHEAYPGAGEGGLKDNAYTNLMTAWTLMKARSLLNLLTTEEQKTIKEKTGISDDELKHWDEIARNLNLLIRDDIIAQYDGYFDLKELDWDQYRKKYGNIHRMDRLLKAEGKSADEYKVAKQADTLQIFYNLPEKEVTGILKKLGYKLKEDYIGKNLAYYLQRTSHGSTLSKVVHTQLANMIGDEKLSFELFRDALSSDYNDIQGGTTAEGIHAGVMAGTVLVAIQSYAGVDPRSGKIEINPHLPRHWRSIGFNLLFRNNRYFFKISHREIVVRFEGKSPETTILIRGTEFKLKNKETFKYQYL